MKQRRAFAAHFRGLFRAVTPCLALSVLTLSFSPALGAETYDLIIRHGRVVDGTGNPAFYADVAIKEGRIAGVGSETVSLRRSIKDQLPVLAGSHS